MYKNINFKDKKVIKSNFYKNKKVVKIDDVDVNKTLGNFSTFSSF